MNGRVLLEGVSDFWLRYFADAPILIKAHEASLEAAGRAYQSMLMSLGRLSLVGTPLLEDFPWQNFIFYEHLLLRVPGYGYLWGMPGGIREVDLLHNVVLSPTRVLERGYDFQVVANDLEVLSELRAVNPAVPLSGWFLLFNRDLFDWDGSGATCPGYALTSRTIDLRRRLKAIQIPDWTATAVAVGNVASITSVTGDIYYGVVSAVTVAHVDLELRSNLTQDVGRCIVTFGVDTPKYDDVLGRGAPVACTLHATSTRVRVLSAWSPCVKKDFYSLYYLYGCAVSPNVEPSTEEYRAFIRGVWNLYVGGPALSRIESAFNVVCGLPVIREDGESILEITGTTIVTVKPDWPTPTVYEFPSETVFKSEVVAAAETYLGVARDGALTLFTDLVFLGASNAFTLFAVVPDVSYVILTDVSNEQQVVSVKFVFDAYLQLEEAVTLDLSGPLEWSLRTGNEVITSGNEALVVANLPSGKTFLAFDALTTTFAVTDYIETPDWWENITLPGALMTNLMPNRRRVTPAVHPNTLNYGGDLAEIGDYGLLVGASDDGTVPYAQGLRYLYDASIAGGFKALRVLPGQSVTVYDSSGAHVTRTILACGEYWLSCGEQESFNCAGFRTNGVFVPQVGVRYQLEAQPPGVDRSTGLLDFPPGEHHLVSWLLMRDFLKWNMFSVSFDASHAQFPRTTAFVIDMLMRARPAHTLPYVRADAGLSDNYRVFNEVAEESLGVKARVSTSDNALGLENRVCVGARDYSDFEDNATAVALSGVVLPGHVINTASAEFTVIGVSSYPTVERQVTGSLCVFAGSNTLIGVGTIFLRELPTGQLVTLGGEVYCVVASPPGDPMTDVYLLLDRPWEGITQIGLAGLIPAGHANRIRVSLASGTPSYAEGISYSVVDAEGGPIFAPTWDSGCLLGGVGAYRDAFVGGMDILIDRHELETSRVGIPSDSVNKSVAEYTLLEHLVDGNSVSNYIDGCTIVLSTPMMLISDLPCTVRPINVA